MTDVKVFDHGESITVRTIDAENFPRYFDVHRDDLDAVIRALQEFRATGGFAVGDTVRFIGEDPYDFAPTDGIGVVAEVDTSENEDRLNISVRFKGRVYPVWVTPDEVEKVED